MVTSSSRYWLKAQYKRCCASSPVSLAVLREQPGVRFVRRSNGIKPRKPNTGPLARHRFHCSVFDVLDSIQTERHRGRLKSNRILERRKLQQTTKHPLRPDESTVRGISSDLAGRARRHRARGLSSSRKPRKQFFWLG